MGWSSLLLAIVTLLGRIGSYLSARQTTINKEKDIALRQRAQSFEFLLKAAKARRLARNKKAKIKDSEPSATINDDQLNKLREPQPKKRNKPKDKYQRT